MTAALAFKLLGLAIVTVGALAIVAGGALALAALCEHFADRAQQREWDERYGHDRPRGDR